MASGDAGDGVTPDVSFETFHRSATPLVSDDAAVEDTVSHLAAVAASIASMDAPMIERSLDFILFPVTAVMRRETEPNGDTATNPKAQARRIKTLEESLKCISTVMRRLEPGCGKPDFIADLFCDVVAVLARAGSDPSLDPSRSSDLEDLRLAAVTCASEVLRLVRPDTEHAVALTADRNLPAVGYAVSLLVQTAHLEAAAGARGSKVARSASLRTLRDLVMNTADPDVWSFFLPGIVSGLAKALHASSGSRSGEGSGPASAADDSSSTEAAIEALTAIVTCVLDDGVNVNIIKRRGEDGGDVRERLRRMMSGRTASDGTGGDDAGDEDDEKDDDVRGPPPTGADATEAAARLKTKRTARWLRETAPRVESVLAAALTPLCAHRKPSVRRGASAAATAVMRTCADTLRGATRTLLECALVARGDPWDSVSGPAALALDGLRRDGYVDDDALDEVILDALRRLPGLVRAGRGGGAGWGGGDGGIACARMAIAAMTTAGSQRVSDMFLTRYAVRSGACAGLAQCFAVSADLASVGRSNELRALGQLSGKENGGPNEEDGESSSAMIEGDDAGAPARTTMNVPVLPRHPPRMLHLSDPDRYSAVAAVARAMGRHCAAAHNGALAALVDAHLDALRDSLEDARSDGNEGNTLWQRSACAHIVVLNETIRGAGEVEPKRKAETVAASRGVLQEYLSREVWDLPTSFDDIPLDDISHSRGGLTLATLRDNALLTCLAAEGVGVVAQACGADFVRRGSFLPQALCPLLQKLGDPAATVSDTAGDVLAAIAAVGGFVHPTGTGGSDGGNNRVSREGPVSRLVAANADYVVDMLSRHLRHLDDHPGAARFFAAVLGRHTGAARRTLPLLHEPVRRALDSMGINARRKNWRHAGTFLGCLREVSDATEAEARALLEAANKAVDDIRPMHDLIEEMERVRSEHFDDEDTEEEGAAAAARMEASMRGVIDASAHSDRAKSVDIPAIIVEWNRRVRHESSLSRLVDGVLSSAAPLLESTDPRVRLAAAEVCSASLGAIAACDACSAPETAVYDTVKRLHPHDVPQTHGDNERPVRLLPRVHQLWPHLMMSLGHRLGPDILPEPFKASLELLRRCAEVSGGDFIARRMSTDAWPQLARVLKVGVKHADSESLVKRMETLYLGADGDTFFDDVRPDVDDDGLGGGKRGRETAGSAPQKTETVRRAIMKTLADIGAREQSRMALRDVAAAAVSVVAPFAVTSGSDGKSSPATAAPSPELISLARDAVKSLATVAPDAVWTALAVNATGHSGAPTPAAPRWTGRLGAGLPTLPSFRDIMPMHRAGGAITWEEAEACLDLLVECGMAIRTW